MKKLLLPTLLLASTILFNGCGSKKDDPSTPPAETLSNQAVSILVKPGTGASYTLSDGKITYAQYDAISVLNAQGTLSNGKVLVLSFGNNPGVVTAYQTNALSMAVGGVSTTATVGRTIYTSNPKSVTATFSGVLADGTTLSGSFTKTPLIIR